MARAYLDRIAHLAERLARAEAALECDGLQPPMEWCLGSQESVVARVFAVRQASKTALHGMLEQAMPTRDGRSHNHVSVVFSRLRRKLADFGWIVPLSNSHYGQYGVLTAQRAAFRAAMTGEGDISHPAMAAPRRVKA